MTDEDDGEQAKGHPLQTSLALSEESGDAHTETTTDTPQGQAPEGHSQDTITNNGNTQPGDTQGDAITTQGNTPESSENPQENLTAALPTPAHPLELTYPGRKIDALGLGPYIIEMLPFYTMAEIARLLNDFLKDNGSRARVTRKTITAWIVSQGEKIQEAILKQQSAYLEAEVWEWERMGIKSRDQAKQILDLLLRHDLDPEHPERLENMTTKQRKELASIVMYRMSVQESGERFMGIGTVGGKRFNVDVNVKVDIIDRMRDIVDTDFKPEEAVDVPYEDIPPRESGNVGSKGENEKSKSKTQPPESEMQ